MYTPVAYQEKDENSLRQCMRDWSFGTIVSSGASGLVATHLPFLVDTDSMGRTVLTTHIARKNSQYEVLMEGGEVLIIFQGPHAYVSLSWYDNQLTFPTWNYTAVHAYGRPDILNEPSDILSVLNRAVAHYDTPLQGSWKFEDMPAELVQTRLPAIAGVVVIVDRLEGKMKLNQDKSDADKAGVIAALETTANVEGRAVAELMKNLK